MATTGPEGKMTSSTEVITITTDPTTTTITTTVISTSQSSIHTTETTSNEHSTTASGGNASPLPVDSGNTIAVVGGVCGTVGVIVIVVIVIIIARRRGWIKKLNARYVSSQKSDFDDKQPRCDAETDIQSENRSVNNPQDTSGSKAQQSKQEINANAYMKMHFKVKDETASEVHQNTATETEAKAQPYAPMNFKQKIHFFENAKNKKQNIKTSTDKKLPNTKRLNTNSDYENESFSNVGVLITKAGHTGNKKDEKVEENEYSYAEVEVVDENDEQKLKTSKVSPKIRPREKTPVTSGPKVDLPLDENEYVVLETSSNTTSDSKSANTDEGYFILAKDETYNKGLEETSRSNVKPEVNRVLRSVDNRNKATRANKDDDTYYSYCTTEELQTYNKLNEGEKRPNTFPIRYDRMRSHSNEAASDVHIYSSADC